MSALPVWVGWNGNRSFMCCPNDWGSSSLVSFFLPREKNSLSQEFLLAAEQCQPRAWDGVGKVSSFLFYVAASCLVLLRLPKGTPELSQSCFVCGWLPNHWSLWEDGGCGLLYCHVGPFKISDDVITFHVAFAHLWEWVEKVSNNLVLLELFWPWTPLCLGHRIWP